MAGQIISSRFLKTVLHNFLHSILSGVYVSKYPDLGKDEFEDDFFAESDVDAFGVSPTKRTTSILSRLEAGKKRSAEDV